MYIVFSSFFNQKLKIVVPCLVSFNNKNGKIEYFQRMFIGLLP